MVAPTSDHSPAVAAPIHTPAGTAAIGRCPAARSPPSTGRVADPSGNSRSISTAAPA